MSVLSKLRDVFAGSPPADEEPAVLAANVAPTRRRYVDPETGELGTDDDAEPDRRDTVRTVLHVFCDGKTCTHD
jgi:hypothetical protein